MRFNFCDVRSHAPASRIAPGTSETTSGSVSLVNERGAVGPLSLQARPRADTFNLTFYQPFETRCSAGLEDLKLHAR